MEDKRTSYDEVPYPGGAFPATHPSHIAMVSKLCGVNTPSPKACRVLELGCAFGANLIPMAESLPHSHFVGIDLSSSQVEQGNAEIKRIGIENVELRHLSITDVDEKLGKFDYIICHGVFSWVPLEVRRAILEAGHKLLTPQGVEYVSYNTYPGWHFRGVVRDMMKYHVEHFRTPQEKVGQARALLKFLSESSKSHFKAYESILKQEAENLESRGDYYIYHEHLEDINEPLYFHEFVRETDAAGLRYLADTAFSTMVAQMFDDSVAELLKGVPLLRREQYMDFLRSRAFRCSLICHQNVTPDYSMNPDYVRSLHVRFMRPGRREEQVNEQGLVRWSFGGGEMSTSEPITAMMERLSESFPAWIPVQELVDSLPSQDMQSKMLECIQIGFVKGVFHLAFDPPMIESRPGDWPACRKLIQVQAETGPRVTNWLHHDVVLQPQQRFLARHMDGSRSRDELANLLSSAVSGGQLRINSANGEVKDADQDFYKKIIDAEMLMMNSLCLLAT